jgi:hypothetical protein
MTMEFSPNLFVLLLLVQCSMVDGGEVLELNGGSTVFMANTTRPFHPSKSLSFAHVLFLGFDLTYADSAGLRGYIAQDIVQLGRYYAKTKFGCITKCDSSDFNGIDGILGLGMPDAALASIPEPLLFAISDETGDPANQYILKRRIFTILSDNNAAELHVGGFDPHAISEGMHFMKCTSNVEYSVPISSLTFDGHELLNFGTAAQAHGRTTIPGILDSGTSCLVIPDSYDSGLFLEKPYSKLMNVMRRKVPFYITIGGRQFEIPYSSWWLDANDSPCVQPTPPGFEGILLGDVIFRSLAVMFDLTHPQVPIIGLAPRNPMYRLVDRSCGHMNDFKGCVEDQVGGGGMEKLRMEKRRGTPRRRVNKYLRRADAQLSWLQHRVAADTADSLDVPRLSPTGGDRLLTKVPVDFYEQTQYFVNISIGTPRQVRTVILDTGSSVLGIFCDPPPKGHGPHGHIYLPHFIPAGMLQAAAVDLGPSQGQEMPVYAAAALGAAACLLAMAVRLRRAAAASPVVLAGLDRRPYSAQPCASSA